MTPRLKSINGLCGTQTLRLVAILERGAHRHPARSLTSVVPGGHGTKAVKAIILPVVSSFTPPYVSDTERCKSQISPIYQRFYVKNSIEGAFRKSPPGLAGEGSLRLEPDLKRSAFNGW